MKVFHSNARVKENLLKNSFLIHAVPREGVVVVAILPLIAGDKDVDAAEAVGGNVALVIEGIDTNIDFLFRILSNEHFVNNDYDTSFIEKYM